MASADRSRADVFPSIPVSEVRRLSRTPDFQTILSTRKIYAFIVYLEAQTIYCKPMPLSECHQKHFVDTGSYIKTLPEYCDKTWCSVETRLKRPIDKNLRKNLDCRTCFKFSNHYFLVKSCFTTGQRTVPPKLKHVYQIGAVRMVLYFVNHGTMVRRREKLFAMKDQFKYGRRNLEPHTAYVIPEGTTYVLLATEKSFFSVHVMPAEAPVPFACTDPRRRVMKRPAAACSSFEYTRPPKTPMIEDAVIGDEDEEAEAAASRMPPPPPPPPPVVYESLSPPPPPVAAVEPQPPVAAVESQPSPVDLEPLPPPVIVDLEPAAATPAYHITISTVPVEKSIKTVTPDVAEWYQSNFRYKELIPPTDSFGLVLDMGGPVQTEALDLSNKTAAATVDKDDHNASATETPDVFSMENTNVNLPILNNDNELDRILNTPCSESTVNRFLTEFVKIYIE